MPKTPRDPLYYHARRAVLHANDTGISHLQRRLRIGYQHAIDLRHALRGDVLEHQADTDTWHIRAEADRHTDFLLAEKLAHAAHLVHSAQALVIAAGAGMGIDPKSGSHPTPIIPAGGLGGPIIGAMRSQI